jgi:hypothetical protein
MTKKHHTVGTVPKPNRKIPERDIIDTPNTQIHDFSLSWLVKLDEVIYYAPNIQNTFILRKYEK